MSRRLILGTAGHIDHGKTTLIKALTGIDTDRLKEEKKRGITIELGFAHFELADGQRIGVVDVPGHERFVRNMVAGASGVDIVALVIAADEGVMPQTREHVDICDLLGIKTGLVVITKTDMVEPDWLDMVMEEVRDYLDGTFLKDAPMIPVSAHTGQGLDDLTAALTELCARLAEREEGGPYRLPVDRVFTMHGFGTVVTGTSLSGRMAVGDQAQVYPSELTARVRGLQVHGEEVPEATSGLRTAINLQGLDRNQLLRGQVVATPGSLTPSTRLDARFKLLATAPQKLKNRAEVHFHIGAAEYMARIIPMNSEELEPGQAEYIQIITEEPVVCLPGDHYVIRHGSPQITFGGGRILSVAPPRRRRFNDETIAAMQVYETGQPSEQIAQLVAESRLLGLTRNDIAARTAWPDKELTKAINELLSKQSLIRYDQESFRLAHADFVAQLMDLISGILADYHRANPLKAGLPKEEIKTRVKLHADPRLVLFAVSRLIDSGAVRADKDLISLRDHKVSLGADQSEIKSGIEQMYLKAGLTPPKLKEVADKFGADKLKEVMELLVKEGRLAKLKDDLYGHRQVLDGFKDRILEFFQAKTEMTTQDFKDLTGVSRKFLIPLAEFYDREGVTIRVGEVRKMREKLR